MKWDQWLHKFTNLRPDVAEAHRPKPIVVAPQHAPVIVVRSAPVIIKPSKPVRIAPPPRGAWQEKGWILEHNQGLDSYSGDFQVLQERTNKKMFFGGLIKASNGNILIFIDNPPVAIKRHPKGPCFSRVEGNWFQMHWHYPPKNIDDAILYVEKVLDQVLNEGGRCEN